MKKFHKRAAVFLTAATLAGLPAGAFFYSSPGSLTVWADNVEVESSEESSPEDVDFSDGSEAEILADPVEQAQLHPFDIICKGKRDGGWIWGFWHRVL